MCRPNGKSNDQFIFVHVSRSLGPGEVFLMSNVVNAPESRLHRKQYLFSLLEMSVSEKGKVDVWCFSKFSRMYLE